MRERQFQHTALLFWLALFTFACGGESEESGGDGGMGGEGAEMAPPGGDGPENVELEYAIRADTEAPAMGGVVQLSIEQRAAGDEEGEWEAFDGEVSWESSEPRIASFEDPTSGTLTVSRAGPVTISAEIGEASASIDFEIPCTYPEPTGGGNFGTDMTVNTVIPPIYWSTAYNAENGEELSEFGLEQIYCAPEFDWVRTVNIILTAGWCSACPQFLRYVAGEAEEITNNGGLTLYIDVQDNQGGPASSAFAQRHVGGIVNSTPGYFVGDAESQPLMTFFGRSPAISAFPSAFVVRTSDMHIITNLDDNRDVGIPFADIAANPDQGWARIMPPPFESNCEDGADEAGEPNDEPGQATPLAPGEHSGGICNEAPDFYLIEEEGDWRFTINFSHALGDIDIFHIDPANPEGEPLGVSNGTDDSEMLEGSGPAMIVIIGYNRGSAPYTISLEAP